MGVEAVRFAHYPSFSPSARNVAMAERMGVEPIRHCCSPDFETGAVAIFRLVSPDARVANMSVSADVGRQSQ